MHALNGIAVAFPFHPLQLLLLLYNCDGNRRGFVYPVT
jgi:hypothetical protein